MSRIDYFMDWAFKTKKKLKIFSCYSPNNADTMKTKLSVVLRYQQL